MNTLRGALEHLQALLNRQLNATQRLVVEEEARQWLASLGIITKEEHGNGKDKDL